MNGIRHAHDFTVMNFRTLDLNLLRVFDAVVAEDPLVRSGLVSLLGSEPGFSALSEPGMPSDTRLAEAGAARQDSCRP